MPVSDGKWYAEQEEFVQSSAVVAFPIALVYREPYDNEVTSRIAVNQNNLRQENKKEMTIPNVSAATDAEQSLSKCTDNKVSFHNSFSDT